MDDEAINLTADIVAAHVSHNMVAIGDVRGLIENVYAALSALGHSAADTAPVPREPAVPIRSSLTPDALICLVCGSRNKILKRHLMNAHGMTPAEYRAEFGLKADYPMAAPAYAETRRALAVKIGLGTRANQKKSRAAKR